MRLQPFRTAFHIESCSHSRRVLEALDAKQFQRGLIAQLAQAEEQPEMIRTGSFDPSASTGARNPL
jgi:hypothetical protein